MNLKVLADKSAVCRAAAAQAADAIRRAIQQQGKARIIAATGSSQLEFLDILIGLPDIAWKKVVALLGMTTWLASIRPELTHLSLAPRIK